MFKTDGEILVTILLGTLLFAVLAVIVIIVVFSYKKRQQKHFLEIATMNKEFKQQLMQSQIEVQESTFATLSKELHDNIGQLLSSTKMLIGVTERKINNPPDSLLLAEETLGKAIQELRSISKLLDKEWLEQFDFLENLSTEVSRINSSGNIHIYFSKPQTITLKAEAQTILFRIVQEAIQNTLKHAQAKSIQINIIENEELLIITIKDDGMGFDINTCDKGIGLRSMQHRINLLKGDIFIEPKKHLGTTIILQLPIQHNQ